ncbi:MAG: signal peptidase I, partial [Pseudomonadales bacterium]|nr:signal peptidase I [Pseudomonadales bacterium]
MDINLPLILVVASALGIVIWCADQFYFKAKRQAEQKPHWLISETRSLLPILLLVLIVRSFIAEPFQIPSSSMEPSLLVGDFILVNKFTYGIRLPVSRTKVIDINQPKRGDVMVFFPPGDKRYFIKRVIGLPGDLIEYRNKQLYINGELQTALVSQQGLDLLRRQLL